MAPIPGTFTPAMTDMSYNDLMIEAQGSMRLVCPDVGMYAHWEGGGLRDVITGWSVKDPSFNTIPWFFYQGVTFKTLCANNGIPRNPTTRTAKWYNPDKSMYMESLIYQVLPRNTSDITLIASWLLTPRDYVNPPMSNNPLTGAMAALNASVGGVAIIGSAITGLIVR